MVVTYRLFPISVHRDSVARVPSGPHPILLCAGLGGGVVPGWARDSAGEVRHQPLQPHYPGVLFGAHAPHPPVDRQFREYRQLLLAVRVTAGLRRWRGHGKSEFNLDSHYSTADDGESD